MGTSALSYINHDKWLNIHAHQRRHDNEVIVVSCSPGKALEAVSRGNLPVSAGCHPWQLSDRRYCEEQLGILADAAGNEGVVAIGEAGLDRVIDKPLELQEKIFMVQAETASRLDKPVIIHCVRAYPDIIRLRKRFAGAPPWIIHGFSGNKQETVQLLKHDIYISFGCALLEKRQKILGSAAVVPFEKVFFETDESVTGVNEVYRFFSRFRQTDPDSLRKQVWDNYKDVFTQ